jgi:hypothetical protein
VGLGAPETGFADFGEETDRKTRAELLDEGLDILNGLWRGQPFSYAGRHYTLRESTFITSHQPVQDPRIPIWVVGMWNRPRSMVRVLRYDGFLPYTADDEGQPRKYTPDEMREMRRYVDNLRPGLPPLEIIHEGTTPADDPVEARSLVQPWAEAGATWWIEADWMLPQTPDGEAAIRARVSAGPPR